MTASERIREARQPNFSQYRAVRVFTESYAPDKWKILDTKRGCDGYLRGDYPSREAAMSAIASLTTDES